ncbi:MAG: hypothetical protein IH571_05935 [Acholeplasmataceae bacterium]|nr:hypothetical protein [Acholeplasmataceae bacterium]
MGQNKKRRVFVAYVLVMQLIFTVAGLSLLGAYIGMKINPDGSLPSILGGLGLALGIIISFFTILQFIKSEDRYERRSQD